MTIKNTGITCVINFSGNVGKSTIAKHIFQNSNPDAKILAVETTNATESGENIFQLNGKEIDHIQEEILIEDNLIVDVGASNIDEFLKGMEHYAGSIKDINTFVIPVTPEGKQQEDSIRTIMKLIEMKVPTKNIKIIFNRVPMDSDIDKIFKAFIGALNELKIKYDLSSYLPDSEFFEKVRDSEKTVNSVLGDETDYRALIKEETDRTKKIKLSQQVILPRLAKSIKIHADNIGNYIYG